MRSDSRWTADDASELSQGGMPADWLSLDRFQVRWRTEQHTSMMSAASDRHHHVGMMMYDEKREVVKSAEQEELSRADGVNIKTKNEIE